MSKRKTIYLNNQTEQYLEQLQQEYPKMSISEIVKHGIEKQYHDSNVDREIKKIKRQIRRLEEEQDEIEEEIKDKRKTLKQARERRSMRNQIDASRKDIQQTTIERYIQDAYNMLQQGKTEAEICEALSYRRGCTKGWITAEEILVKAKRKDE